MVGLCGTDLNTFRGSNPLVTYPRVLGHEIAATVLEGSAAIPAGTRVTVSPYTACGICSSCRRGRSNACRDNQTFGVQRDGALTELHLRPRGQGLPLPPHPASELCLVEPLTVGFHAVARGRVTVRQTPSPSSAAAASASEPSPAPPSAAPAPSPSTSTTPSSKPPAHAGATDLIHSAREDFRARLRELTDGHGPDVIIEAIGLPETFRAAVEEVAFTGRVVYIGYAKRARRLRNQALRPEGARHPRLPQRPARRLPRRHRHARSQPLPRRPSRQRRSSPWKKPPPSSPAGPPPPPPTPRSSSTSAADRRRSMPSQKSGAGRQHRP